ncbi:hypothetical protein ACP97I_16605 [Raoultella ornithinolytica]|uniref:hypothetical protein n=1 Tax=Raoultella ornithinolytica TaxID=54291 RepID=UPI003D961820
MADFKYEIAGELLLGFYENDTGTIFQSQVKVSDYDSELMASAAAQALGEQYSENYSKVINEQSTN